MTDYLYYHPERFGLAAVGEIDWSDGNYQFDLTVVWQRVADGTLVYGEDSGCSCPAPFESFGIDDLHEVGSLKDFQEHCAERQAKGSWRSRSRDGNREAEIVALIERMHTAGAR